MIGVKLESVRVMPDCAFCDSPGRHRVSFQIDGRGVEMVVCHHHATQNTGYIQTTLWQIERVREALAARDKA